MPVNETVMGLGDWSLQLSQHTPQPVLDAISTPFGQIVITKNRTILPQPTDNVILPTALYLGVCLRPGPQLTLGGCGPVWWLGDDNGGAGVVESGVSYAASTALSSAVSTILFGSPFSSGSVGAGSLAEGWSIGFTTRRDVLNTLARWFGYEWRINPDLTVDVAAPATIYGSTPTGVIVRRDIGREAGDLQGLTGAVGSTWDWEQYGSKTYVWSQVGSGTAGGASSYRDPAGNPMTIVRGFEYADAPLGSESDIADWWLSQINRSVRTVAVSTVDYAVTGQVPCGGYVYLYDRNLGLYDTANPVQFGGGIIWPVSARVVSVSWPIERGMGVYYRLHNGTSAEYVDLSDYVLWESPGTELEVSTGAQQLAPPTQAPPIAAFFSPWQEYDAEWRATGSNPAIGNGTISVSFRRLGTTLEVNGKIVAGSTSTYGSGEMRVTLPPNCAARTGSGTQLGNMLLTSAAGVTIPASLWVDEAATEMRFIYWSTSTTATSVTPTAPFTWAANAKAEFNGSFEIDP